MSGGAKYPDSQEIRLFAKSLLVNHSAKKLKAHMH
jgi:hypothetical protein